MEDKGTNPVPEIDDEFTYEVIDESAPQVADAELKLQAQIAELEAKLAQTKAAPAAPLNDGLTELAAAIKAQNAVKQPSVEDDFNTRFQQMYEEANKTFHDKPLENATKISAMLMEKMQADMMSKFNEQAVTISQLTAMNGPDAEIIKNYGDEVREIASSLPPSGDVYQKAIQQVKMNHFDEIMEAKLTAKLAELSPATPQKTAADIYNSAPFTNANAAPAPGEVRKPTPKFTQAEMVKLEQWGKAHMLDFSVPGNKEYVLKKFAAHKAAGGRI